MAVTAVDEVERGGLSVEKQDSVTGSTPQGDANFEGITFEIINNSQNPVIVNSEKYNQHQCSFYLSIAKWFRIMCYYADATKQYKH